MKEIGGYFEFGGGLFLCDYHKHALKFNSSRNALRYFVKKNNIKTVYLPFYFCDVIYEALKKEKCVIKFYSINENFEPILNEIEKDSYVYIINYFGIFSNRKLKYFKKLYKNIIVDNTHAFFRKPLKEICTIYNCRKYFGVPDGAYMYSNIKSNDELEEYEVLDQMEHLIGRLENNASKYYNAYSLNEQKLSNAKICKMSKVTSILMGGGFDYKKVYHKRIKNYNFLYKNLSKYQKLKLPRNLTFMYPLYIDNAKEIRKKLIEKKIYVPLLWPNVIESMAPSSIEYKFANNILLLPCDQRYSLEDMQTICNFINEFY